MKYCRFCGKELINGECNCDAFQYSIHGHHYSARNPREKEPFFVTDFTVDVSSPSGFISSIREQSGLDERSSLSQDPYEYNVPIVPDCIQPEENEIVVKQYNIAKLRTRLKFMKAEGRLMITNRRLLFRAAGKSLTGNTLQEHQFNLDEIGGIEIHKDYKFSLMNLILCCLFGLCVSYPFMAAVLIKDSDAIFCFGVILSLLLLTPTVIVYKKFWLKACCAMCSGWFMFLASIIKSDQPIMLFLSIFCNLVAWIDVIIVCFVPNLVIKIKSKGATGAVIIGSQKSIFRRKVGDDYSGFAEVLPWEDTVMAINELGTIIDDLQKQGDYAIEKWSK